MKSQVWLDTYVERVQPDLSRVRGYMDEAVADVYKEKRRLHPKPQLIPGEVLAMDVRDRLLLAADNPVFKNGSLLMQARPNCGVLLVERGTGVQAPVRKWPDPPSPLRTTMTAIRTGMVQDALFDVPGGDLPGGLHAAVYWSTSNDMLQEFRAVLVDGLGDPDERARIRAVVDIPPVVAARVRRPPVLAVVDDFEDEVRPRRGEVAKAEEGGSPPGR